MTPLVIGLSGRAGCGKDVAAAALTSSGAFISLRFAAALKDGLNAMFGFTNDQWEDREWKETEIPLLSKSPRQLAQTIGTEWGREMVHPEVWVSCLALKIKRHIYSAQEPGDIKSIVIPDLRFQNEAQWIKDQQGIIIEIQRDDNEDKTEHSDHKSEGGISLLMVDHIIQNNGTVDELKFNIRAFAAKALVERAQ